MDSYAQIFKKRGRRYDQAMRQNPTVRSNEFARLFDCIDGDRVERVLDVPSGGEYLSWYVPDHWQVTGYDPCNEFVSEAGHAHCSPSMLEEMSFEPSSFDLVVSLAALHHVENKGIFLKNCRDALKTGGYLCVADVEKGDAIADFLDGFTGSYNQTGHSGEYWSADQAVQLAVDLDMTLVDVSVKDCPWVFEDRLECFEFCRELFGLNGVSLERLQRELEARLGFRQVGGKLYLNWRLLYATFQK